MKPQRRYYKKVVEYDWSMAIPPLVLAGFFAVIGIGLGVEALVVMDAGIRDSAVKLIMAALIVAAIAVVCARLSADVYYVEVRK